MQTGNNSILIVDDEKMISEAVSAYFTKMGWRTFLAENGTDALKIFRLNTINFVILDLMLPGISGEEVCKEIRKQSRVPIIMLTAKTREESVLNGFLVGADDYVTKPFSIKELYARTETIMRRVSDEPRALSDSLSYSGELVIDFEHREVKKHGSTINLTKSEWIILSYMAGHPKKVFTRSELVEIALGDDSESYDRAIDTHIKNLRKKIEDDPKTPVYIKTVHGIGYKFGGEEI